MEWMTVMKETLKYLEENLWNGADTASAADAVHVSPLYLSRGFQILTGFTVTEYVRSRRLYEAALQIKNTGRKVIDAALDCGYDSPDSFTKAFCRFHGSTPQQVRAGSGKIHRFQPLRLQIQVTGGDIMDYSIENKDSFQLIGFERTFSEESAYREIPGFWDEIREKFCFPAKETDKEQLEVFRRCRIGTWGLCTDGENGNRIRYMIAGEYSDGPVPQGMKVETVPGGQWARFRCTGPVPDVLQATNTQIFREWLPGNPEWEQQGCCTLEWYSANGDPGDADYESAVWIPVQKK